MSRDNTFDDRNDNTLTASKGGDSPSQSSQASETVFAQPLEVRVYNNSFDKALRAFRALVQKERILSEYKEKQSYEKPSDKKRRKRNEAKRKLLELDSDKPKRSVRNSESE